MEILLVLIISAANIASFIIGAKVGQQVSTGKPVEPVQNPVKVVQEIAAKKEMKRKSQHDEAVLANIDAYDGSPYGQREVPRG